MVLLGTALATALALTVVLSFVGLLPLHLDGWL